MPEAAEAVCEGNTICLQRDREARDWAKSFGCTVGELLEAVKSVGTDADAVYSYLKQFH